MDGPLSFEKARVSGGRVAKATATPGRCQLTKVAVHTTRNRSLPWRALRIRGFLLAAAIFLSGPGSVLLGQALDGFDPNVDGTVNCLALQPDGRILIGGGFAAVAGIPRARLARLNRDGTLDAGFDAPTGEVFSLAVQGDGKILVGGFFTTVAGVARDRIARLEPDGTLDEGFSASAGFYVYSIGIQTDARILIGGSFTTVNGVARNRVARLNADGTLDEGFDPDANGTVYSTAIQMDGKILIGGAFTTVGGVARNRIARLNADGSLDTGFDPNAGNTVACMAVQPDGRIVVAGAFTTVGGVSRSRIARLNPDGSPDTGFGASANNHVGSVALQADGKVLIGGTFTTVGGVSRSYLARLNPDGSRDPAFSPILNAMVGCIQVEADGGILCGGSFTTVAGNARNRTARLRNDTPAPRALTVTGTGRIDWMRGGGGPELEQVAFEARSGLSWVPQGAARRVAGGWSLDGLALPPHGWIRARGRTGDGLNNGGLIQQVAGYGGVTTPDIAVEGPAGEQILPGGGTVDFGTLDWRATTVSRTLRVTNVGDAMLTGLSASIIGTHAAEFAADFGGGATLAPGASATLTLGFTALGGGARGADLAIASDDPDEAPFVLSLAGIGRHEDPGFAASAATAVRLLALQPDGKILMAGTGAPVRLKPDGTADDTFTPPAIIGGVLSLAVRPDGTIALGGSIQSVNGVLHGNTALLNADGSPVSPSFARANAPVNCLAMEPDGATLMGGQFGTVNSVTRRKVARINADGELDAEFNPDVTGTVSCLAVAADGGILIGGEITQIGGVTRNRIARLEHNGGLDATFDPNADGAVTCLAVQADGKILLGGDFSTVGGVARRFLARVNADGTVDTAFDPMPSGAVHSIVVQTDGRILVAGAFTHMGRTARNRIARLNPDGTLDEGFDPNAWATVNCLALQPDGGVLAGGEFTNVGGVARNRIARLPNDTGATDALAVTGEGVIHWMRGGGGPEIAQASLAAWDGSGWSDLGTAERIEGGWSRSGLVIPDDSWVRARAHAQGGSSGRGVGLIEAVAPSSGQVPAMVVTGPDGQVIISELGEIDFGVVDWPAAGATRSFGIHNSGTATLAGISVTLGGADPGEFALVPPATDSLAPGAGTSFTISHVPAGFGATGRRTATITVVSSDSSASGMLIHLGATCRHHDPGFDPNAATPTAASVFAVTAQPDRRILVGGFFDSISGKSVRGFARLNPDGSADPHGNAAISSVGAVFGVGSVPDGGILLGGSFSSVQGVKREKLARLNADGGLDPSFDPSPDGTVTGIALQADAGLLVWGYFTKVGGVTRNRMARLEADGTLDAAFDPNANDAILAAVAQPDGKIVIGGLFTAVGGLTRNRVARLNQDGTVDADFDPNCSSTVYSLALQPDGRILVGGQFGSIGNETHDGVARLNPDGTPDATFDASADAIVRSIVLQADGRILLGGDFQQVSGVPRKRIARLDPGGSLDLGFDPGASDVVHAIALQHDGAILVGGEFTTAGGVARNRITRLPNDTAATATLALSSDGSIKWMRGGGAPEVEAVAFAAWDGSQWVDLGAANRIEGGWRMSGAAVPAAGWLRARGRTPCGGSFGMVEQLAVYGDAAMPDIAVQGPDHEELESPWDLVDFGDQDWPASGPAHIFTIRNLGGAALTGLTITVHGANAGDLAVDGLGASVLQPGQSLTFSVVFTPLGAGNRIAQLSIASNDADESPFVIHLVGVGLHRDPGFTPVLPSLTTVSGLAVGPDGKVSIGGSFGSVNGVARNRAARLGPDGGLDPGFDPNASETVFSIAVQPDGKTLLGGNFTGLSGASRRRIGRMNADGTLDTGFDPNADGTVWSIAMQADDKILIGGIFNYVGGVGRRHLARLNADGTLDPDFNPGTSAGDSVNSIVVQPDGKIVLGGDFNSAGGAYNPQIARLHPDGTPEGGFRAPANGSVHCVAVQPDGRILMGGEFTTVHGVARDYIARLHPDGTLDTDFNPRPDGMVYSIALQADGGILIGGGFWRVAGMPRSRIARLACDGSLDPGFNPGAYSSDVHGVALQADGKILAAGGFQSFGGVSRNGVARVPNNIPAVANLTVGDGHRIDWMRGGGCPEIEHVSFETWDGTAWLLHGHAMRIQGGWSLPGVALPASTWVRVRGRVIGGRNNGSCGLVEQVERYGVAPAPAIVVEGPAGEPLLSGAGMVDFGAAGVGRQETRVFTIRNTGTAVLEALALEWAGNAAGDFIAAPLAVPMLAPGESTDFSATFAPAAVGSALAVMRILSNDAARLPFEVQVAGSGFLLPQLVVEQPDGVAQPPGGVLDFGAVAPGTAVPKLFTIRNTGPGNLALGDMAVVGPDAADFALAGAGTLRTLRPGESTTLLVVFAPSGADSPAASLRLESNDPDCPAFVLTFAANTTPAPAFKVELHGIPGEVYHIQRSTDLKDWVVLATVTANPAGEVSHTDEAPPRPKAFYRLAMP